MALRLGTTSLLVLALLAPALPAQASNPAHKREQRLALLDANAGEPVASVRFIRPANGYEVVGPLNVLLWETPSKAWLLDLRASDGCRHLDRELSIGLDSASGTINTRNTYVVGGVGVRCRVDRIRKLDVKAWKQAEREAGIRE